MSSSWEKNCRPSSNGPLNTTASAGSDWGRRMLEVGDKAPLFDLMADEGKQIRLKDLKGRTVVLYFYPKDDTPGCTKEACSFRDRYADFQSKAVLLGVSLDDVPSHQAFRRKY